ncbi:class I SAM-dependent methyltransferase family protein [Methanolapillus ohkumae]|uniref:class I SAM-dependent methyltransferase n=1 Tax=Methanolapillus ohkumae TaxID=3028298 RepID=UPI0030B8A01E
MIVPAFRILRKDGEPCRRFLDEIGILNHSGRPYADDIFLYFPLLRYPNKSELSLFCERFSHLESMIFEWPAELKTTDQPDFGIDFETDLGTDMDMNFGTDLEMRSLDPEMKEIFLRFITVAEFLLQEKQLTVPDILGYSVAYEMIGDIAVIDDKTVIENPQSILGNPQTVLGNPQTAAENPQTIAENSKTVSKIASAILSAHPSIKTVLLSGGPVSGEFRVRDLEFVAGNPKTSSVHKEYGCAYKIDLARAYFTPRLSTERFRILSQISDGDFVIDMFAGVGPYSILIAKNKKSATVVSNDKNEAAVELLAENMKLNKVTNIIPLNLDALDLEKEYAGCGDHILMNLPHNACDFLDTAVALAKPGGILHYYAMTEEDDLFDGEIKKIRAAAKKQNREIQVIEKKTVRSYAPHQYNICLDVRIL